MFPGEPLATPAGCPDVLASLTEARLLTAFLDSHLFLFRYLTQFSATSLFPSFYRKQTTGPVTASGKGRAYHSGCS